MRDLSLPSFKLMSSWSSLFTPCCRRRAWGLRSALGPLLMLTLGLFAWLPAQAELLDRMLDNGMRVIVKTDRRAPVVVSQLWYRAGSMDERYGVTGVAHVLEHMMFKGTRDVPAGEFSRRIAAAGGRENAFTSRDHTVYFQTLQRDRLELALRLEADRMANLLLDADEFAREINVVIEERRLRTEDNPQARLYEALMATAYVTHPYRHPVIGWMDDLQNMRLEDAREWYEQWYAPNNAVLVVAGDVDAGQVYAWARQYFGDIPARPLPVRKPLNEPEQAGAKRVTVRAPAELPLVALAWQAPRLRDPERDDDVHALEILAGVLDGHASARLNQALVRERAIATQVGAGYGGIGRGPGLFIIDATPARGIEVAEVEAALKAEVARLVRDGIGEAELARVKAQVLASQVFQQDSLFSQAMRIGSWVSAGLDHTLQDTRYARLAAVTAEQVRDVAARYLVDDRVTVAVLEPLPLPQGPPARPRSPSGVDHVR